MVSTGVGNGYGIRKDGSDAAESFVCGIFRGDGL